MTNLLKGINSGESYLNLVCVCVCEIIGYLSIKVFFVLVNSFDVFHLKNASTFLAFFGLINSLCFWSNGTQ